MNAANPKMFDLSEEVSVVIGGTGILGGRMAQALAAQGSKVAIVGRNQGRGAERVSEIESDGGNAIFVSADALVAESLNEAKIQIESMLGAATVLVNATGGNRPEATLPPGSDFCKLPLESWHQVIDLNLVGGALLPCQIFGEAMLKRRKGSIINIASMARHDSLISRSCILGRQSCSHQFDKISVARVGR